MGMTIDEKIEEDLKHCSLNGVKYSDYVKEHYISKADYENRLKADLKAILAEIQLEIEELDPSGNEWSDSLDACNDIIQQKINSIKAESEGNQ